jgi:hypothetical protein
MAQWHASACQCCLVAISVDPEVHGAVNEVAMKRALAIRIAWTEDEGIHEMRNGRFRNINKGWGDLTSARQVASSTKALPGWPDAPIEAPLATANLNTTTARAGEWGHPSRRSRLCNQLWKATSTMETPKRHATAPVTGNRLAPLRGGVGSAQCRTMVPPKSFC